MDPAHACIAFVSLLTASGDGSSGSGSSGGGSAAGKLTWTIVVSAAA
jgi:hypothetical protein